MAQFLIDYKDGTREHIEDHKGMFLKHKELKKENKLDTVKRFCSVDHTNSIQALSIEGLDNVLQKGDEPEMGYVIFMYGHSGIKQYKTHDFGVSEKLEHALILDYDKAQDILKYNTLYKGMLQITKEERDSASFKFKTQ